MNESFNHAGAWGITLIVIVLVSWFFYRYFAPKNWREWAGAGVVQAVAVPLVLHRRLQITKLGHKNVYICCFAWPKMLVWDSRDAKEPMEHK